MPRTRNDLVLEVLDLLGVTQVGQPAADEDAEKVDQKIDGVVARLSRRRVVYIPNIDNIDDEYFDSLAVIVANNVGPKFGQPYDAGTDATQEGLLREMQQEPGVDDVVCAQYY